MVRPASTPVGTFIYVLFPSLSFPVQYPLRTRPVIHQHRKPNRQIRKVVRRNFPTIPPNFIPNAIPSFSMNNIWNQFPITLKCSPMDILVLTRILITWSMTTNTIPRMSSHLPLDIFITLFPGHLLLGLDGQGGVRYETEPLLRDELAGHAAYAVGLVLNPHESCLKILDELILALSELAGLLP